ncbi:hypothetical protein DVH24_025800 [Malus domestica]|uniref:Retrotransposon gag domain-containing protein n=1 Tax=Malus domestica TaxID=3750 RepID=A0A498KJS5_MALDO|nr:hypothetical protein DVH24_025800 [Malus domestica]
MEIKDVTSLEKFSQPRFKSFRDNSDPNYYIIHYRNAMALDKNDDAWMCKMFSSTLGEPAMRWYSELLARSVDYNESFVDMLTNIYLCHEAMFKMVPQSKDESLRTYLKCF